MASFGQEVPPTLYEQKYENQSVKKSGLGSFIKQHIQHIRLVSEVRNIQDNVDFDPKCRSEFKHFIKKPNKYVNVFIHKQIGKNETLKRQKL